MLVNFNKKSKGINNEPNPNANGQQPFESKHIGYHSEPVSNSGVANQQTASLFQTKPASPAEKIVQPGAIPPNQPEAHDDQTKTPDLRLRSLVNAGNNISPQKLKAESIKLSRGERARRAYWDVTASLSLIINIILVSMLLIMTSQINNLKTTINSLQVKSLLSGFYSNFVEMDNASISTTITVNAQVPVNFMLPIRKDTDVTLTQNVVIPNAYVVINSGGLSINSVASVTLPKGTNLPITLNMDVPVVTTLPVTLQVPVDIPLAQTELHKPFTGLQDTLRPYYCLLDKNAQYPLGIYICNNHDAPASTTGVP
jgi:hypothetical protein